MRMRATGCVSAQGHGACGLPDCTLCSHARRTRMPASSALACMYKARPERQAPAIRINAHTMRRAFTEALLLWLCAQEISAWIGFAQTVFAYRGAKIKREAVR